MHYWCLCAILYSRGSHWKQRANHPASLVIPSVPALVIMNLRGSYWEVKVGWGRVDEGQSCMLGLSFFFSWNVERQTQYRPRVFENYSLWIQILFEKRNIRRRSFRNQTDIRVISCAPNVMLQLGYLYWARLLSGALILTWVAHTAVLHLPDVLLTLPSLSFTSDTVNNVPHINHIYAWL